MSQEPLPISLVAHAVFCARRAWLESVGERVDSSQIEEGTYAHRAVDDTKTSRPGDLRAVAVHHEGLGVAGRCDVIRPDDEGRVQVLEFKASPVRRKALVTDAQRVQVALQVMSLESMGIAVSAQSVYFVNHETAVPVVVDEHARREAVQWVEITRRTVEAPDAPKPLFDDPRCTRCSHASVCLPDEHRHPEGARRISVSDPDGEVLHLTTPGSRASISSGRVRVVKGPEVLGTLPLERVVGIVVHGNIDLSSALIREMAWRRLPIVWCSGRGRVVGWLRSAESPHGRERVFQHALSQVGSLDLARGFVSAKVSNQATQLRRNGDGRSVPELRLMQRMAEGATSLPDLFAVEGRAAALYFDHFCTMLGSRADAIFVDNWAGRVGRGARDPLNSALNFTYGMLVGEAIRAIAACGLDPAAGFLHSSNRNKPALALDLMEEFRAPLADSVVLGAINNGSLGHRDFTNSFGDARLLKGGRDVLVRAFERRLETEIKHPTFGYQVSWRRAIEVQPRMILGYLDGTATTYRGIRTR